MPLWLVANEDVACINTIDNKVPTNISLDSLLILVQITVITSLDCLVISCCVHLFLPWHFSRLTKDARVCCADGKP